MADKLKIGLIISATDKMSRIVDEAVSKSSKKMKMFEKSIKSVGSVSNKVIGLGVAASAGIYEAIEKAEESVSAQDKLNNVFEHMWGNSDKIRKTAEAQGRYAENLALEIGVDKNIIKETQAKLATFQHVSNRVNMMNGVFKRATKASVDLATIGFGEASQNAVLLGKALEDPMRMATAMKRTGSLTAEDVIKIQTISQTKGRLAAQMYVLKAVERQVKGSSKAAVKSTDIIKVSIGAVINQIGMAFLPTTEKAKEKVQEIVKPTIAWVKNNHSLIVSIAEIGLKIMGAAVVMKTFLFFTEGTIRTLKVMRTAFLLSKVAIEAINIPFQIFKVRYYSFIAAQKIATAVQLLFNTTLWGCPIIFIVGAVVALTAGVIYCYKNFKGFRDLINSMWDVIKKFGGSLLTFIMNPISAVIKLISGLSKAIGDLFSGNLSKVIPDAKIGLYNAFSSEPISTNATPKSSKIVTQVRKARIQNSKSSRTQTIAYSPTINIGSGSQQDKQDFAKMLRTHKHELAGILKEMNNNNSRLSFEG